MMDKFKLIFGLKTAMQVQLSETTIKSRCVKLKPLQRYCNHILSTRKIANIRKFSPF